MKNNKIYPLLALVAVLITGCAKENEPAPPSELPPLVQTEISFQVNERTYVVKALENPGDHGGNGCSNNNDPALGYASDNELYALWTAYSAADQTINITRQNAGADPAFRLNLWAAADLDRLAPPYRVENARLTLTDMKQVFVSPENTGAVELTGHGEAVSLTITARQGDLVEGVFSGTLTTAGGVSVRLEHGVFKARLQRM